MRVGKYEILIESTDPSVREAEVTGHVVWVGVPGAAYAVRVQNHDDDYRVFATLHIDGQDVNIARPGYGLLAEPNSSLQWDGYRMDQDTVREFRFSDQPGQSVAVLRGSNDRLGFIDVEVVRESEKWLIVNPPSTYLSYLTTAMGEFKASSVREAAVRFRWGGPREQVSIRYGTEDELREAGLL